MIIVTTPTGAIGRQVGADRVIVRDSSRLSSQVRERVHVVQGSQQRTRHGGTPDSPIHDANMFPPVVYGRIEAARYGPGLNAPLRPQEGRA